MFLEVIFYILIVALMLLFLLGVYALVRQYRLYTALAKDFEAQKEKGDFSNAFHRQLLSSYRAAAKRDVGLINTPAMIEKVFYEEVKVSLKLERIGKQAANFFILVGLMGAFVGFLKLIEDMRFLSLSHDWMISADGAEMLLNQLIFLFDGAKEAFMAAFLGFFFAIVYMILKIFIQPAQILHIHFVAVESYLDNVIALDFSKISREEAMGQATQELFDRLIFQVENAYKKILEKSVSALMETAETNALSAQDFNMAVKKIERLIQTEARENESRRA